MKADEHRKKSYKCSPQRILSHIIIIVKAVKTPVKAVKDSCTDLLLAGMSVIKLKRAVKGSTVLN